MGEVLPNAIPLMAKAAQDAGLTVNGTVKEMMALQQTGGLISSKVLPHFAKRMSLAAKANGGLENAMKSNRVAMNQMITAAQTTAETIFKSGWSEGLTDLFKATGEMLMENETLFISLGKIAGKVFKGIAWVIRNILSPAFSAFGSILNAINETFSTTGFLLTGSVLGIWKMVKMVRTASMAFTALGLSITASLWPVVALVAGISAAVIVAEELAELFAPTGKKTWSGQFQKDSAKENFREHGVIEGGWRNLKEKFSEDLESIKSVFVTPPTQNLQQGVTAPPVVLQTTAIFQVDGETISSSVTNTENFNSAMSTILHSSNF